MQVAGHHASADNLYRPHTEAQIAAAHHVVGHQADCIW